MGKSIFRFNHPEEAAKLREQKYLQTQQTNSQSSCSLSVKSQSMPTLYMKNDPIPLSLLASEKK